MQANDVKSHQRVRLLLETTMLRLLSVLIAGEGEREGECFSLFSDVEMVELGELPLYVESSDDLGSSLMGIDASLEFGLPSIGDSREVLQDDFGSSLVGTDASLEIGLPAIGD